VKRQPEEAPLGLAGSMRLDYEFREGTVVRSPLGQLLVPGRSGWECPCPGGTPEHAFASIAADVIAGYELGFAAATRDPWDGRCSLEVLMFEEERP